MLNLEIVLYYYILANLNNSLTITWTNVSLGGCLQQVSSKVISKALEWR